MDRFLTGACDSREIQTDIARPSWRDYLDLPHSHANPATFAAGGVAGGLAGLFLVGKNPKKLAKYVLKIGGVALVGGLTYKAWQDWNNKKRPSPEPDLDTIDVPKGTVFSPSEDIEGEHLGRILVRAMISAAKADGRITDEERRRISDFVDQQNFSVRDQVWLKNELRKPADFRAVARGASCPEVAAGIYMASLLAVDPDGKAERGYLQILASELHLGLDLVDHLHAQVAEPAEPPLTIAAE